MPSNSWAPRLARALSVAPLVLADVAVTALSWALALLLRYDAVVSTAAWQRMFSVLPVVLVLTVAVHRWAGLYDGVLKFASVLEARQILAAQFVILTVSVPLVVLLNRPVPLSVPLTATVFACGMSGALRFWHRLLRWRDLSGADRDGERMIVIGAGEAGVALVRDVQQHHHARVVAFLDDDPRLVGRHVLGVRVEGTTHRLQHVTEATGATRAVLAITGAPAELVRRVVDEAGDLGVGLSIVPPSTELLSGQVSLQDVRDIEIADLLGRAQIDTDLDVVRDLVKSRRVLVTGGGGSIGSELARQLALCSPARLVILDHDETHLFEAAAGINMPCVQRLVDIRDTVALERAFREERPDIVFHAAAHKHVPVLETHAVEATHTNILGTHNVVRCAERSGTERLVFISTDKAVRPSSVMGRTKLVSEHLVLDTSTSMTSCAVRFGNVLGSRGSVVPTFVRQIRQGQPLTITDARMTRYFMSIPEAVRLVLHAAALSEGGEIFMLDMGRPVRIIDLAKRMIQLSGQRPGVDVEIRVTAIRPGEKLEEELHAPDEAQHPTSHPSIVRLDPVRISAVVLETALTMIRSAVRLQDESLARVALGLVLTARDAQPGPSAPQAGAPLVGAEQDAVTDREPAEVGAWT